MTKKTKQQHHPTSDKNGSQPHPQGSPPTGRMKRLFGFDTTDLSSWENFVLLMNKPCDPAALGVWRAMFGLLMVIDLPQERGLSYADVRWGDPNECRFPLLNFLDPLPLEWMYVVYLVAFLGALGLMLGFLYRLSCVLLLVPYWYLFLLDKTRWNNHSYLYGLITFMFTLTDANRCYSLDSLLSKRRQNAHVPLWNYAIFRAQFFIVYFVAGLKKLDMDWVTGYSMNDLSRHWVFQPFTHLLTHDQIDLYIVHGGGLMLDLTAGYVLFFDLTRPLGTFFLLQFHIMNSQIFSIGMFPYTCIAATPLFYSHTWPKYIAQKLPTFLQKLLPSLNEPQPSSHCVYSKEFVKPEDSKAENPEHTTKEAHSKPGFYHHFFTGVFLLYLGEQVFLPYSHGLTKGYNNWTNGLYGYSWDMMVHSWSVQHIRITAVQRDTGEVMYLNPEAWTVTRRWSSHADMTKQYAVCIEERLAAEGVTNISLYFDVYRSLNDRFQQRQFDPRVDILAAEWRPFHSVPWVQPLLVDLSDWRTKLAELEKDVYNQSSETDVVFIADFPGLSLDQFIPPDLGNTTLTILNGEVIVELNDQNKNFSLKAGEVFHVPADQYHTVYTVSATPSCYMYLFINTTERQLVKRINEFQNKTDATTQTKPITKDNPFSDIPDLDTSEIDSLRTEDQQAAMLYEDIQKQKEFITLKSNTTMKEKLKNFVFNKYVTFYRGYELSIIAFKSILNSQPMRELLDETELESNKLLAQLEGDSP